jgi:hypothetical protein
MFALQEILETLPTPPLVHELCDSEFDAIVGLIGSCLETVQGTEEITMAIEHGHAHPIWQVRRAFVDAAAR